MGILVNKTIKYEVFYEIEVDNGYEYDIETRSHECKDHLEAIQFADDLYAEGDARNIVAKHYGVDFYVPEGGNNYAVYMTDDSEKDETLVSGQLSFIEALRELMKLQWQNKLSWVSYRIEYLAPCPPPVCPPAPDNWLEDDELPF